MKQSLRTAFFVSLMLFAFILHAPITQASEGSFTLIGGMTGSSGLGQQYNSPLGGFIFTLGEDDRLEFGSTFSKVKKVETGSGHQFASYVRVEKQLSKRFFALGGLRVIESGGGAWRKYTSDWTVGGGIHYVHRWNGSEEKFLYQGWASYNQDFASKNSQSQRKVRGAEIGFRITNGTPRCSLFAQLLIQPVRYEQLAGADFEKRNGKRVTMTLGLTQGW